MRIAYVSHVDSRWIKQRPQFIAEALQQGGHSVTYVCSSFVRRGLLIKAQGLSVPVLRVPMLPQSLRRRLKFLDLPLSALSAVFILLSTGPDIVVFTHSRHHWLAQLLRYCGVRVFYDCMDLNGLFSDAVSRDTHDERHLIDLSERVFCSSERISKHVERLSPLASVTMVPNALNASAFRPQGGENAKVSQGIIGYVGAVSSWFDFEAVLTLLDAMPEVTVQLWGPCDVSIPAHERLTYGGILPHEEAISAMRQCSVLLLPFEITELILAVDPVKVYEYVATGRPVVAVSYPQLDHFGDWIHQYKSTPELISQVKILLNQKTLEPGRLDEFIAANNWNVRAKLMIENFA